MRYGKFIKFISASLALLLLSAGCRMTILEFPEGEGIDPTLVETVLTLVIDPNIEPYSKAVNESVFSGSHDMRFQVEIYRNEIAGEPLSTYLQTFEASPDVTYVLEVPLHPGRYQVVAWMDFVDKGLSDDLYYDTSDLSGITIADNGSYIGNEDCKDTYTATAEVNLESFQGSWFEGTVQTMTLERPMAKIEFISTDVPRFVANMVAQKSALIAEEGTLTTDDESLSTDDAMKSNETLIHQLNVTLSYEGWFPCSFNAYTDRPNDARTGVSFTGNAVALSENEAHLASDYVFVNGHESSVMVTLRITDENGVLVNEISGLSVPIERGKLTTIKDDFLTKDYNPGIGIDPSFDGDILVTIPD